MWVTAPDLYLVRRKLKHTVSVNFPYITFFSLYWGWEVVVNRQTVGIHCFFFTEVRKHPYSLSPQQQTQIANLSVYWIFYSCNSECTGEQFLLCNISLIDNQMIETKCVFSRIKLSLSKLHFTLLLGDKIRNDNDIFSYILLYLLSVYST